jgi:hypothetical protein
MLLDGGVRCCELLHMLLLVLLLSLRPDVLQQCCIHRIVLVRMPAARHHSWNTGGAVADSPKEELSG